MAPTASDVLVDRLIDWGVDTIFGIPGDGINGIMEALRQRKDEIRFVQVRLRKPPHSWPAVTPNGPGGSVCVLQLPVRVAFTS